MIVDVLEMNEINLLRPLHQIPLQKDERLAEDALC